MRSFVGELPSDTLRSIRLFVGLAALGLFGTPNSAAAFELLSDELNDPEYRPSGEDIRWNAQEHLGVGLHDGIQVAVSEDFATNLTDDAEEASLVNQAVQAAFAAWESPALQFDVGFTGAEEGTAFGQGAEIDVFAVPSSHPAFDGQTIFGRAVPGAQWVLRYDRRLSNGLHAEGQTFVAVDIFINVDLLQYFAPLWPNPADQQAALQRLLMHEIGHALGLHHANEYRHWDTDDDPFNEMVLDACDGVVHESPAPDLGAIMAQNAPLEFLTETELHPDDRAGRDFLYPKPPEETECADDRPEPRVALTGTVPVAPTHLAIDSVGTLHIATRGGGLERMAPGGVPMNVVPAGTLPAGATSDVATDSEGRSYLSRFDGDRVLRVDLDGNVVQIVSAAGAGPGEALDGPSALAIAQNGDVYVTGALSHNILRVAKNGVVSTVFDQSNAAEAGVSFSQPSALAISDDGALFVAAAGSDNVLKIDVAGAAVEVIGPAGDGDGAVLSAPNALALGHDGSVFVLGNESNNVFHIGPDGVIQEIVDAAAGGIGQGLSDPRALAIEARTGHLYVVAMESANVLRVRTDGRIEEILNLAELELNGVTTVVPSDFGFSSIAAGSEGRVYVGREIEFELLRINPACGDSLDNDGDGFVDLGDPDCIDASLSVEDGASDPGDDEDSDPPDDVETADGDEDTDEVTPSSTRCSYTAQPSSSSFIHFAWLLIAIAPLRRRRQ